MNLGMDLIFWILGVLAFSGFASLFLWAFLEYKIRRVLSKFGQGRNFPLPLEVWGEKITIDTMVAVDIFEASFPESERGYVLSLKRKIEILIRIMYSVTVLIILSIVIHVMVR